MYISRQLFAQCWVPWTWHVPQHDQAPATYSKVKLLEMKVTSLDCFQKVQHSHDNSRVHSVSRPPEVPQLGGKSTPHRPLRPRDPQLPRAPRLLVPVHFAPLWHHWKVLQHHVHADQHQLPGNEQSSSSGCPRPPRYTWRWFSGLCAKPGRARHQLNLFDSNRCAGLWGDSLSAKVDLHPLLGPGANASRSLDIPE